jgi:hypothetical protein
MTREEFIKKAIKIHGYRYDYSKVEYVSSSSKVIIICGEQGHGEFLSTPHNHLRNHGCRLCANNYLSKLKTNGLDSFIARAKTIHGDKYDYSKFIYKNCKSIGIIICAIHGDFTQSAESHYLGSGCPKCSSTKSHEQFKKTTEEFIKDAKKKHGDLYEYSKVDYSSTNQPVIIICRIHGEFSQRPSSHIRGGGCFHCGIIKSSNSKRYNTETYIESAKEKHGELYDYSKVEYLSNHSKIIIICKTHGEFLQTATQHLSGRGCTNCGIIKSSDSKRYNTETYIESAKEKHGELYDYSKVEYLSSDSKIIIICKKHGEFLIIPNKHLQFAGCQLCAMKRINHSKCQIKWLDFISLYNQIQIQHAENEGEFKIPNTKYSADGYCQETNTIYEFHGDYWHGNPKMFNPTDINTITKKTYGELYQKTLRREKRIRDLGYNYVIIWEKDWKNLLKSVKKIQQKFRKNK